MNLTGTIAPSFAIRFSKPCSQVEGKDEESASPYPSPPPTPCAITSVVVGDSTDIDCCILSLFGCLKLEFPHVGRAGGSRSPVI